MKAARIHRYGGNEVVVLDEVPVPSPGPGEVFVRIRGAAVNPVDWKLREGYLSQLTLTFPYTLGCDLAGIVEAVGEGVTRFAVGDAVYGYPSLLRGGAFAEGAILLEDELALAPKTVPLEQAAALPVAAITAYEGLITYGELQAGQRVLVLGGAGGVGSAAVQLARWKGAEVFATASTRNQEFVRSLGATPIDYTKQSPADVVQDVDLVFDTVGVASAEAALPCLKEGGVLVSSVYALPEDAVLGSFGVRAVMFGIQPSGKLLTSIAEMVDLGALKVFIEREFSIDETATALALSQTGRTRGKLLIRPSSN